MLKILIFETYHIWPLNYRYIIIVQYYDSIWRCETKALQEQITRHSGYRKRGDVKSFSYLFLTIGKTHLSWISWLWNTTDTTTFEYWYILQYYLIYIPQYYPRFTVRFSVKVGIHNYYATTVPNYYSFQYLLDNSMYMCIACTVWFF